MSAKRPRGRPPVENGEGRWFTMRISDERLARYQRAAAKAQESLSAWAKRWLDKASK